MPDIRVTQLKPGMTVDAGRHARPVIARVVVNPVGCPAHVHVVLEDRRRWCYDLGAVETVT